jgi:hypothetical protein
MKSKKVKTPRTKTLKGRIHRYISKKQDICCEENVDRKHVIQQIVEKYKTISKQMNEPDEYLSYIDNDLVMFIGYFVHLKKNNDVEGMHLWTELDKRTYKDQKLDISKIEQLLHEVPLYYLLALLGYATYRENLF